MKSIKFVTGLVRLSYANIWAPKEDLSGRMRYSASLLIKKSDTKTISRLKAKIKELINDEEAKKILGTRGKDIDLPLRDGDTEREGDDNYAGHYFLNAKATEEKSSAPTEKRSSINLKYTVGATVRRSCTYLRTIKAATAASVSA